MLSKPRDLEDVVLDDLSVHEVVEFVEKMNNVDWKAIERDVMKVGDVAKEHSR